MAGRWALPIVGFLVGCLPQGWDGNTVLLLSGCGGQEALAPEFVWMMLCQRVSGNTSKTTKAGDEDMGRFMCQAMTSPSEC